MNKVLLKNSFKRIISNTLFMLGYAMKHTPAYLINTCLYEVYSSVQLFFEFTFCMKYMVDLIQFNGKFSDALKYMAFVATSIIIKLIWSALLKHSVTPRSREKLHMKMKEELFKKAAALDLSCYYNPEYYNDFIWSVSESDKQADAVISNVAKLLGRLASIFITGVFLVSLNSIGLIFVGISLVISLAVEFTLSKLRFKMELEIKPYERKRDYINRVFYLNNYSKEIRLNLIAGKLQDDFNEANNSILKTIDKHSGKQVALGFTGGYLTNNLIFDVLYLELIPK